MMPLSAVSWRSVQAADQRMRFRSQYLGAQDRYINSKSTIILRVSRRSEWHITFDNSRRWRSQACHEDLVDIDVASVGGGIKSSTQTTLALGSEGII